MRGSAAAGCEAGLMILHTDRQHHRSCWPVRKELTGVARLGIVLRPAIFQKPLGQRPLDKLAVHPLADVESVAVIRRPEEPSVRTLLLKLASGTGRRAAARW